MGEDYFQGLRLFLDSIFRQYAAAPINCGAVVMAMFESLDFLYVPAPDIESSVKYYTEVLAGKLLWKIHAYGVWVACVQLTKTEPYILLADHIEKKDVMLIYRVANLDDAAKTLRSRGWKQLNQLEIPPGPCCTFRDPAGNALVIYENQRPSVMAEFMGKIDTD